MRKRSAVAAGFVLVLGCGSNSGSNQNAATSDPAALDFCLKWANDVCRLAYLCVDSGAQDTAFHARYGQSQADCWQGIEGLCTSNQTGSATFGPSCGAGKTVNVASADACTSDLESQNCASWAAAPAGACDAVCTSTSDGAAGAGAGGNGAGMSSGGATANPGSLSTPTDFCIAAQDLQCDLAFECEADQATAAFGSADGCKASVASDCAGDFCQGGYDASQAAACIAAASSLTCAQSMAAAPPACALACQ